MALKRWEEETADAEMTRRKLVRAEKWYIENHRWL